MPTIDELAGAASVSDLDELVVSQSGVARKVTRGQILAGVQAALALPQGSLLGRKSAGLGSPETISIGANLTLAAGVISAAPRFDIGTLPVAGPVQPTDLVAVAQGGQSAALSYAALVGGLAGVAGVDGSGLLATATGTPGGRTIAALFADAVTVESFGAVGNGATDDTAAFARALASGRPLRLGAKIYIVNGTLAVSSSTAVIGVAGATVLRRGIAIGAGPWIDISAAMFAAADVIFDAGSLLATDAPAVHVSASCLRASFSACVFSRAYGLTAGSGLFIECPVGAAHSLENCNAAGNLLHGISVVGLGAVRIARGSCSGNGGDGISVAGGAEMRAVGVECGSNRCGISIGDWSTMAAARGPSANVTISDGRFLNNTLWAIAISADAPIVTGNTLGAHSAQVGAGGLLLRSIGAKVSGNMISNGLVGIDCRGCNEGSLTYNHISDAGVGIQVGGSQRLMAGSNFLLRNGWGITISPIEPLVVPAITDAISVQDNWIGFSSPQGGGIRVLDGASGVGIERNSFVGWGSALSAQALWLHTDLTTVRHNSWNGLVRTMASVQAIGGIGALVVPDACDGLLVISAAQDVQTVMTAHQVDTLGQLTFIRVTAAGTGYSRAQVTVSGMGSGATGQAVIVNGGVAWAIVSNPGSGYGPVNAPITVTIAGDGIGAAALGFVGLPVVEGRRIRISCNCSVRFAAAGAAPGLQNWTLHGATVPANGAVEFEGTFGQWRAVAFPPVDYLAPTGDGGIVVQSIDAGDLTLRAATGGNLRVADAAEPAGYALCMGRGSPEGVVTAAPGSDFRNLDGGAGRTFWIKQSGSGNQGWYAVA